MRRKIGNYKIIRELGQGGMATVYLGIQMSLERHVAVKELMPSLMHDHEMAERFRREARVSASLTHEGIVSVYDFWKDKKSLYLAMEYLEGKTLEEILETMRRLPVTAATMIVARVADALHYSHQRGIIHRDVKPSNIFITRRGEVKLTDFGIAYTTHGPTLTQKGMAIGTPAYMSPERIKGQRHDHRSDIFSLGMVLYELVTGSPPFVAEDDEGVITKILEKRPRWPKMINGDISWGLQWTILRCLRKHPRRRFRSMEDLKIALEERLPKTSTRRDQILSQFVNTVFSDEKKAQKRPFALVRKWKWATVVGVVLAVILGYGELRSRGIVHPEKWLTLIQARMSHYKVEDYGRLRIVVYPWAKVHVDGKYLVTTPIADPISLAPGRHHLLFTHTEFGSRTMEIDLTPGEERLIVVKMGS